MTTKMPDQYYQRYDASKEYDELLYIAGRGLQSAELNDTQKLANARIKAIADVLFKDGAIVRDAGVVFNKTTGIAQCAAGTLYVRGAVRGVSPATMTIPLTGSHSIGVRLTDSVVTSLTDATLLDPATATRNFNTDGAARLKVHAVWGWDGDGATGDFFPVYSIVDGQLGAKEPPPNLDVFNQALARYDRDSAGGSYVVSGLNVTMLADSGSNQVYSIDSGRARVFGYAIEFATSRRAMLAAVPDLKAITAEPTLSTTTSAQRVLFARPPGSNITQVVITAQKTVTLVHGVSTGAIDPLPDTSVLSILTVTQGATTYTATADYKLTAGKVDWTPTGAEPAPGSSYNVTYQYQTPVTPTLVDDYGFTVTGAVVGTLIQVSYSQKLPRIDRLCLDQDGNVVWILGVAAEFYPQAPEVPGSLLALATITQTWTTATRKVTNDGVRVVPMPVLAAIDNRIDHAMQLIAQNRLESSIHTREGGTKLGLFTDPFLDDSQRDAGTPQTAAVVRGELVLPIDGAVFPVSADITNPVTLNYVHYVALSQPLRTGDMKINPYMNFAPVPAHINLTPSVDRWTQVATTWLSATTSRFTVGTGDQSADSITTRTALLSTTTSNIETLRQIEVSFEISGFGPGEVLSSLTFDGVAVTPVAV